MGILKVFLLFIFTIVHGQPVENNSNNNNNINNTQDILQDVNATKRWMSAVEELLAKIHLGPLKSEITPEYLGKRFEKDAISSQSAHFRARLASAMLQASKKRAFACIDPAIHEERAIKAVQDELSQRKFKVTRLKKCGKCPVYAKDNEDEEGGVIYESGAALVVELPLPADSMIKKDEL